ncbi:MAG: GNAT family N-acetyltransferase [Pseudomonadota bacterium]
MRFACETAHAGPAAERAAGMRAEIPVLETERLTLRAPVLEDFQTYAEIVLSPRGRHLDITSRDDAWYDFAAACGNWLLRGHGIWTVTDTAQGATLGFVLLGFEPGDGEPELGYLLSEAAEGQGIGHEAAQAVLHHARTALHLPRLVSYVDVANDRSIALAQRLGGRRDDACAEADDTTLVFRHLPDRPGRERPGEAGP